MTRHENLVRLRHMLAHAREAVAMVAGKERERLRSDRMLELALVRLIDIVGEAAARVSPEGQSKYSSIPWRQVVGMRNRLVHRYDRVDLDVLWDTIEDDLPPLIAKLERVVAKSTGVSQRELSVEPSDSARKYRVSVTDHPAFAMWKGRKDLEDVEAHVWELRKGRFHAVG
jgi:uncharacterized protein with HEPN domain